MLFNYFKGKVANLLPGDEFGAQAEMYLGRAVKLNEKFAPAWTEMGEWAWKRGNTSEAKKFFQYALDHVSPACVQLIPSNSTSVIGELIRV